MDAKINEDEFVNPFVFKTDWKTAFEDEDFVKVFSSDILENYIINKRWYGGKASTLKYIEVVDFPTTRSIGIFF
jgi:maltose alpha-D-glucosyltransferase/alpha-amylase